MNYTGFVEGVNTVTNNIPVTLYSLPYVKGWSRTYSWYMVRVCATLTRAMFRAAPVTRDNSGCFPPLKLRTDGIDSCFGALRVPGVGAPFEWGGTMFERQNGGVFLLLKLRSLRLSGLFWNMCSSDILIYFSPGDGRFVYLGVRKLNCTQTWRRGRVAKCEKKIILEDMVAERMYITAF